MSDPSDRANERIEAALAKLGAEYEPPPGWEARVLAATQAAPRRPWWRSWWAFATPGLVLAAAAVILVIVAIPQRSPAAPEIAVRLVHGKTYRGDDTPAVGDIAHIAVTGGGPRALWIYHRDALVMQCPGAPECRIDGHAIAVDLALELVGEYRIIALDPAAAPTPSKSYDADLAALQRARVEYRERTLNVP
ncbi:MAG TPA: hypothetical protein VK601_15370 [Kofleriaceae bacterium]|nr:hypothetical protein [Kofleriaceae bacterium]